MTAIETLSHPRERKRIWPAGLLAAASLLALWFVRQAVFTRYLEIGLPLLRVGGLAVLILMGVAALALFAVYRRRGYSWIVAVLVGALWAFEPGGYPIGPSPAERAWDVVRALYVLALLLGALFAVVRLARRGDELERHVNLQALAISLMVSAAFLLGWLLLEQLLPVLRPVYVVLVMTAAWLIAHAALAWRYR